MSRALTPLLDLAAQVREAHARCQDAAKQGLLHALKAGQLLLQVKERVDYGKWLSWLEVNCQLSERLAQRYMQVARQVPKLDPANTPRVADLSLRQALTLIGENEKVAHKVAPAQQAAVLEAASEKALPNLTQAVQEDRSNNGKRRPQRRTARSQATIAGQRKAEDTKAAPPAGGIRNCELDDSSLQSTPTTKVQFAPPYLQSPGGAGLPVARTLLPGRPQCHLDLVSGEWVDVAPQLFSSSQYWFVLTSQQPILRDRSRGFCIGDELLLETDREKFSNKESLRLALCVIKTGDEETPLKLAAVNYYDDDDENGPARLQANTFDLEPDATNLHEEAHYRRALQVVSFRGKNLIVPPPYTPRPKPAWRLVQHQDIVAVWLKIVRRPYGLQLTP